MTGEWVVARVRPEQRYAWRGPCLLVMTLRGECEAGDPLTGLYFREARHLRTLRLLVNGVAPWICAEGASDHDAIGVVYVHPEVTLRGLRVGGATASVRFVRDASGESHAEVLHKRGTLHLVHQPPPEPLAAGLRDRFGALVESVLHH